jgi:hypothetical protein
MREMPFPPWKRQSTKHGTRKGAGSVDKGVSGKMKIGKQSFGEWYNFERVKAPKK